MIFKMGAPKKTPLKGKKGEKRESANLAPRKVSERTDFTRGGCNTPWFPFNPVTVEGGRGYYEYLERRKDKKKGR